MLCRSLIAFLILALFIVGTSADLTVKFLDVGQGDAILLESRGHYMLIDAGPGDVNIMEYLGPISQLDYLVATHPHEDHIGGMVNILNSVPVGTYVDNGEPHTTATYKKLVEKLVADQIPYVEATAGNTWIVGDAKVKVVAPASLSGDLNGDSLSLLVTDGSVSFLLPGDNEFAAVPATILKVAHHGSSGSTANLGTISPEIAIISVGKGNTYSHPSGDTINALRAAGVKTYRTDQDGTVTITSDGSSYTVSTEKKGTVTQTPTKKSTPVPTVIKTTVPTPKPTQAYVAPVYSAPTTSISEPTDSSSSSGGVCSCSGNVYNCGDFPLSGGVTAQQCYNYCKSQGKGDIHGLDRDKDGSACEG